MSYWELVLFTIQIGVAAHAVFAIATCVSALAGIKRVDRIQKVMKRKGGRK